MIRILVFLNQLGLGGTEKAALLWARELCRRRHEVHLMSLQDGPHRLQLQHDGVNVLIVEPLVAMIGERLTTLRPEVIHAHAPGHHHAGDIVGEALALLPKIPVVQTNIFLAVREFTGGCLDRFPAFYLLDQLCPGSLPLLSPTR